MKRFIDDARLFIFNLLIESKSLFESLCFVRLFKSKYMKIKPIGKSNPISKSYLSFKWKYDYQILEKNFILLIKTRHKPINLSIRKKSSEYMHAWDVNNCCFWSMCTTHHVYEKLFVKLNNRFLFKRKSKLFTCWEIISTNSII